MSADASPDTPVDRLFAAIREFLSVSDETRRDLMAVDVGLFDQLHAALSLALHPGGPLRGEASGTPVDPDVLAVLEYVSAGRGYVDVEPYPDVEARRALGRLRPPGRQP